MLALLGTAIIASGDEFHQTFLPNRTGTPWDVLLDCCGALVMQWFVFAFMRLFRPNLLLRRSLKASSTGLTRGVTAHKGAALDERLLFAIDDYQTAEACSASTWRFDLAGTGTREITFDESGTL